MPRDSHPKPTAARLKAKRLAIDTFRENVVVLSRHSQVLRPERLVGSRRVEVSFGSQTLLASPIMADEAGLVAPDELGVPQPLWHRLAVEEGTWVDVSPARRPASLAHLRAKLAGATFTALGLREIVADLAAHRWTDMDVAAFLVSCASFMTAEETLDLTRAMVESAGRLSWDRPLVVDKHCIGGIPGNRTSLIVAPIVAAHGMTIPKTSSRAITSPAGTADTMEVLARVDLTSEEMHEVVDRCGGCVVWGGQVNLSPADDVLISVERPLGVDTAEQMVASILSKKVAAGSTHLLLDLPFGPSAKVRDTAAAQRLRKLFEFVGARMGLVIDVALTQADQPIGRGVGPLLEARDVLAVLHGSPSAPADLREKGVMLAGRLLEMDPMLPGGQGQARARELLESGAAARKLHEICEAQGPSPLSAEPGALTHEATAPRDGTVTAIDCLQVASIARSAGAPTDAGAGLLMLKRIGDPVRRGEPLCRIHACDRFDFGFAIETAGESAGFTIQ
jgi:thymidine phosphorylase